MYLTPHSSPTCWLERTHMRMHTHICLYAGLDYAATIVLIAVVIAIFGPCILVIGLALLLGHGYYGCKWIYDKCRVQAYWNNLRLLIQVMPLSR